MDSLMSVRASMGEWTSGWRAVLVALGLLILFAMLFLVWNPRSRDIHKRGAKILEGRRARRKALRLGNTSGDSCLTLGGVRIAPMDETKHFKLIGTTGTGKSTAIRELLRGSLERGDRAVITDPDSGYLVSFYDKYRGDVVLNPFEKHSVKWNPFTEIREIYDIDQLAGGLIPSTDDASGREWRGYARTFLSAVLRRCHQCGPRDVAELWRLLAIAPSTELRPIVAGTPAQPFLEPDNARMFGSIRSVAGSAAAALAYIKEQRALSFSVRDWVQSGRGVLFIPYQAGQIAALRSIIATWMRLAIVETMSHPEEDQRLWFVVDELDALGAIDGLKDALARLRKFGGRCVLGFQSIAQVSNTYGAGEAQTIVENCGNTLILRCSGSENGGTSQFASRLIGDREIVRRQTSRGRDRDDTFMSRGSRRSTSTSEQHVTEAAVMASQLEQLPDLTGYLKTASSGEWLRVAFSRRSQASS
jgi:type IV secretory pathway TraG/TraD family ATPase VirD4